MKRVKIGIVGAGIWGEVHASIYNEHYFTDLVAICDKDISLAKKVADMYNIPEVYADYREMAEKCECDAVAIVTPDHLHADITVAFAEKKRHLLIEKPIATKKEDVFTIMDVVEKNGIRAMVDLHNRWNPPFNKAKQEIEKGTLGDPYTAYIRHSDVKSVATDMIKWADKSSIMWFLGSHSVDTLTWLFDDRITRVYCAKRRGILEKLGIDTDDIFLSTLHFEKGGIAHMENGWVTPNGNTNINDFRCSVMGTKGMISIDASSHNLIQMVDEHRAYTPDILVTNWVFDKCKGLSYEAIRDFIDCLVDDKPFKVSMEDARDSALVILALLESAETGMPVDVKYT